jgi:type IV pilus assembly protein PilN
MIQINLLPVRTKKKREHVRQFIYIYVLSIVLTVSAIGYLWITQKYKISSLNGRLTQLQAEVAQYAKYEAMLKELTSKREIVDKKRAIILDLQKDRDTIPRMLALLSVQVPAEKMWFEKFVLSANGITMEGVALSNEAVAEFMRNLESSPYVEKGSVNLTHSRQVVMQDMKLREFQVTYRFFPFSAIQQQSKKQAS